MRSLVPRPLTRTGEVEKIARAPDASLGVAGLLGGLGRLAVDDANGEVAEATGEPPVVPDARAHDAIHTTQRRLA